jgi:uncharacterized protein DUF998
MAKGVNMPTDNEDKPQKISMNPARLAIWGTAGFLVLLALLHVIKPEVDPTWQTTSEYAIGQLGWLMIVAFLAQAVGLVALFWAIKSQISTRYGKFGLVLLILTAIATVIAGIFVADPINTPQNQLSTSGSLHGMGAGLALLLLPFAMLFTSLSLMRKNPVWKPVRAMLLWAIILPFAALAVFMVAQAVLLPNGDGNFGPEVTIGWYERTLVAAYSAATMLIAWSAVRLHRQTS